MLKKCFALLVVLSMLLTLSGCGLWDRYVQGIREDIHDIREKYGTSGDAESTAEGPEADFEGPALSDAAFTVEQVILDNADCLVKISAIDPDAVWGYAMQLYIENRTADTALNFSTEYAALNGYMCEPYWSRTVEPGQQLYTAVEWDSRDLETAGITDVLEISFHMQVYDDSDWEELYDESVLFYPQGKDAYAAPADYPFNGQELVLLDNDDCTITVTGFQSDGWDYTMLLYVENKTERSLAFSMEDVNLNGRECDPYWYIEVVPEKRAVSRVSWYLSDLEDSGISHVEWIRFRMEIYGTDDWTSVDCSDQVFTVYPF